MKLLTGLTTVFNENLADLIRRKLAEEVATGSIAWAAAYDSRLDEIVPKLTDGTNLTLFERTAKIDRDKILDDLSIVRIYLTALGLESANIDRILGTHELLRKDNVKTITDIRRRYLDIVNHSVQEFKTRDVEIRDGKIRLFPALSQSFKVREISAEYLPKSLEKRVGNDPTPENISTGTDKGYWETTLYTRGPTGATAIVTMDFGDTVSFNRLKINSAGKFPVTVEDVEILDATGAFTSVHTGDVTTKFVNIVYPEAYETSQVRITLTQTLGRYVWWTDVTNERDLIKDETREDAIATSTRESRQAEAFIPIVSERLDNCFSYSLGAYNIILYLDIYPGNRAGVFYSRKYTSEVPIETVKLSDELVEYKPSLSTIAYTIIQQDGSRVAISPGQKLNITKTFTKTQTLSNGRANWVELTSAPLRNGLIVFVNGEPATLVDQLTGTGALECVISGRKLFFSIPVEGKTVTARYNHKTDFFIVEASMSNNVQENCFDSPSIENFAVEINSVA